MSTTPDLLRTKWIKSSYSGNGGGTCVEWAPAHAPSGTIPVRDSKRPTGPILHLPTTAFADLVSALKDGALGS
ncbi:DUF397 domain-containing protein [Streptomyces mobaraensis]|uniref:DUF397 domain-containing protein n=1 Tax=Streptomyces mobaraensis TaxID=35621 RepID=A0A5N5WBW8_STRMB|nr:DUF397 domain-containing protein [Streptomyces mobaraensis]KAB7849297.1 DUF397 domain-containing protein [Streptomyces mobaraensis]